MTTKQIKKLAMQSFKDDNLDIKKMKRIVQILRKKELKTYIKFIKNLKNEREIKVFTAVGMKDKKTTDKITSIFPNKKVRYFIEPGIIAGIRITDNDMVYEFNLKDSLENLIAHIKQSYDQ